MLLPRHLQNKIEIITVSVRQFTELKLPSRIATVGLVNISTEQQKQSIFQQRTIFERLTLRIPFSLFGEF